MGHAPSGAPARQEPRLEAEKPRQPSDQSLLEAYIARGDEAAFATLVERYGKTVWGVCRRVLHQEQDTEDAFQAVFVILARKAASIRKGEAVGSWLYGVAYRTAMKARRSASRRENHERQAGELARRNGPRGEPEPWGEAACREIQRVLDEEVQRLGEKYRAPFVLCCLEHMSKAEAAKELGWKEGTISGRLARARRILEGRLARRGIVLSAALTTVTLAKNTADAASLSLLHATATGAPRAAASTTSSISPAALRLADTVIRGMGLRRLKVGLLLLLGLVALLGGGTLTALQLKSDAIEPDIFVAPPVPLGTPIDERILSVAFTPDGTKLFTAGGSAIRPGQIQTWDVVARKSLSTQRPLPGVRSMSFAPDGRTFATGDFNGDIKLRDAASGEERASIQAHAGGVTSVSFAPDSKSLLSAGLDKTLKLWQANGLTEQKTFVGHKDVVLAATFFNKTPAILSGSEDATAIIWDVDTGKAKLTLRGQRSAVEAVAVSADDKLVASASRDGTVRLWNADTGEEKATLDHGATAVYAVAFSRDSKLLGSAAADGMVRLWDVSTHKLIGALGKHRAAARAIAFSPDGSLLASGGSDKIAHLWHVKSGDKLASFEGLSPLIKPIQALAYSPDGNVIAMATTDPDVQIRDASSGNVLRVLKGHAGTVNCLAFSPDGQTLATGGDDRTMRLWDWQTGQGAVTWKQGGEVYALAFTRDGRGVIAAGSDGVPRLWEVDSGNESKTFPGHVGAVHALAVTPAGRTLVTGGADQTIRVWDLVGDKAPSTLQGHKGAIRALVFAADGVLASAGDDSQVKLWEPALDRVRLTLAGQQGEVRALAFTPRGRTLVSAGADKAIRVWDGATGELRTVLHGHKKLITALTIHPRGRDLVSGGQDTMGLRWRGKVKAVAAAAVKTPPSRKEQKSVPVDDVAQRELDKARANLDQLISVLEEKRTDKEQAPTWRVRAGAISGKGTIAVAETSVAEADGGMWPLLIIAGSLATMLTLGTWFYIRRRGRPLRPDISSMSFACSSCGKQLRARAGLAGKSVKCPACAVAVVIPASDPSQAVQPAARHSRRLLGWLVAAICLVLVGLPLCYAFFSSSTPAGQTNDIIYDFRGRPVPSELTFGDSRYFRSDGHGLRITLPKKEAEHLRIGLRVPVEIRGDFETTMTFEILRADSPPPDWDGWGVGVLLRPNTDAGIGRYVRGGGNQVMLRDLWRFVNGQRRSESDFLPCSAKSGRMRLRRSGSVLHYLWSPEMTGDNFEEIHQCAYPDDVSAIRLIAEAGKAACELDIRISELRIKGAGLVASTDGERKSWFWPATVMVVALAIGFWMLGQRQGELRADDAIIHLPCSGCSKTLNVKGAQAGRKVKCPQCGASTVIPATEEQLAPPAPARRAGPVHRNDGCWPVRVLSWSWPSALPGFSSGPPAKKPPFSMSPWATRRFRESRNQDSLTKSTTTSPSRFAGPTAMANWSSPLTRTILPRHWS